MSRPHLPYEPALDGVRGLAVAGVLCFHAGFSWMPGGFLGVSTFFTLSGFLIARLLVTEFDATGRIALGAFWSRRFRRLMPALFVTVGAVAVFGALVASPDQRGRLRADGLATLGYVANWRFLASDQSYGALFASPSPLLHAWSLAIEEQFYLLFPLLVAGVLAAGRGSKRTLTLALGALAATSAVLMPLLHRAGDDPSRVYYGTDTRVLEILAGTLLALWVTRRRRHRDANSGMARGAAASRLAPVAGVAALLVTIAAWTQVSQTGDRLYEGGFAAYALVTVALIAAARARGPVAGLLAWRPLRWLGRVSYAVYLFHWPLFLWLSPARTGLSPWPLFGLRLAVTFGLAALSYRLVEQPVRTGRLLTAWRPFAVAPVAFAAAALALVAVTIDPPRPGILFAGAAGETPGLQAAPARPGGTTVLVAGDSVSLTIAAGMARIGPARGVRTVVEGALGCGLAQGGTGRVRLGDGRILTEDASCRHWPRRWAAAVATTRPAVVLLTLGAWDAADRERAGTWTQPCAPGFDAWYDGLVRRAVRVLHSTGAPVVLTSAPYLRSAVVTASRRAGDRRIDCMNAVFRRVARDAPGASLLDLAGFVCPRGRACRSRTEGVVLRRDGIHYDGPGGDVVAGWVLDNVLPASAASPAAGGPPRAPRD